MTPKPTEHAFWLGMASILSCVPLLLLLLLLLLRLSRVTVSSSHYVQAVASVQGSTAPGHDPQIVGTGGHRRVDRPGSEASRRQREAASRGAEVRRRRPPFSFFPFMLSFVGPLTRRDVGDTESERGSFISFQKNSAALSARRARHPPTGSG